MQHGANGCCWLRAGIAPLGPIHLNIGWRAFGRAQHRRAARGGPRRRRQFVWNSGIEPARRLARAWCAIGAVENDELLEYLGDGVGSSRLCTGGSSVPVHPAAKRTPVIAQKRSLAIAPCFVLTARLNWSAPAVDVIPLRLALRDRFDFGQGRHMAHLHRQLG